MQTTKKKLWDLQGEYCIKCYLRYHGKVQRNEINHRSIYYFESVKMGHVHCIDKERQISTFWTVYCLKSWLCIWQAKHHALHLLQDEALNAYSFNFWKYLSTTMFHRHHNFLPNSTTVWMAACSDYLLSLIAPDFSRSLVVRNTFQPQLFCSSFEHALKHQAAERMFAASK